MQARLTAHLPEQAAIVRWIRPDESLRIGRSDGAALRLAHPSVSRDHASLACEAGVWRLRDHGSKNGSYLDGVRAADVALPASAWLRFGDVFCEFAALDGAAAEADGAARRARRAAATAHTLRIEAVEDVDALLDASLRGAIELAQCERGFVLLREGGRMAVRASLLLDHEQLFSSGFSGSIGAVDRALNLRRSLVVNDIGRTDWLAARASVVAAGLSALVCLPLLDGDEVLGVVYADRVRPGHAITTLDQELLEAFAERAALWIAARKMQTLLAAPAPAPPRLDWQRVVAAHGEAVHDGAAP